MWMSLAEAAAYLGYFRSGLRKLVHRGDHLFDGKRFTLDMNESLMQFRLRTLTGALA